MTGIPVPSGTATTVLMILAVGACFDGSANSVRELIKERVIYERERATGLSRSAYLMSKVIGLGVVSGVVPVIGPAIAAGTLGVILSNAAAGAAVAALAGPPIAGLYLSLLA